jgi:hypothetical protein
VLEALEDGLITRPQAKVTKGSKDGHAYFKFRGGTYDGVELRLYPPFEPFTYGSETWVLERTFDKNGKQTRSLYVLQREEP